LSQITDKLDLRTDGRSIDVKQFEVTSYLSAPNRLNSRTQYVVTVYRIFIDLSHMGWQQKHTAFCNLTTHSVDKIVKPLTLKKEQIHKVEQG